VPNVKKIWGLNLPGTPWACSGLLRETFTFVYPWKDEKTIGYRISPQLKSNTNIVIKKEIDYIEFNYSGSEFVSDYIEFKY
jgi:hypothetical protein